MNRDAAPIVRLEAVEKHFGAVHALDGVDLSINPGVWLSLVGHNGAGKSTLLNLLSGSLVPDRGTIAIDGVAQADYSPRKAKTHGIRSVFQELSLCPNLTAAENMRVAYPSIRGPGWRRRAAARMGEMLERVFPGHDVDPHTPVQELSLGRRQMVEIARAFSILEEPARLVILDEPTSALDSHAAGQLLAYMRRAVAGGMSLILISHFLGEVLAGSDRIMVLRDGKVAADDEATAFDHEKLVHAMGGAIAAASAPPAADRAGKRALVRIQPRNQPGPRALLAHEGEIVGLAGLAGQGQSALLRDLFATTGTATLVSGDRQADGIFSGWSIAENIGVGALRRLRAGLLLSPEKEAALANDWRTRIAIRTPDIDAGILSLSGGNQQKVLFARALASDARIVLMDDPMRGVDIATKREIYALIRAEAQAGRTFLWYTTETGELGNCDHIYVFRGGAIVADLPRGEFSEERIVEASFRDAAP